MWDSRHAPKQARLHYTSYSGSWSSRANDLNQWLQVDLGSYFSVTRIATQGRYSRWSTLQWVTKYRLQYSDYGLYFEFYKTPTDTSPKVLLFFPFCQNFWFNPCKMRLGHIDFYFFGNELR